MLGDVLAEPMIAEFANSRVFTLKVEAPSPAKPVINDTYRRGLNGESTLHSGARLLR